MRLPNAPTVSSGVTKNPKKWQRSIECFGWKPLFRESFSACGLQIGANLKETVVRFEDVRYYMYCMSKRILSSCKPRHFMWDALYYGIGNFNDYTIHRYSLPTIHQSPYNCVDGAPNTLASFVVRQALQDLRVTSLVTRGFVSLFATFSTRVRFHLESWMHFTWNCFLWHWYQRGTWQLPMPRLNYCSPERAAFGLMVLRLLM